MWIDDDMKKMSQNSKAKSILCYSLRKNEFNKISACKSAKKMWDKLKLTHEGTDKVRAIEEENDLMTMSLKKLIGSLMAHEINMERLGESSTKKKCNNALKAAENTSESDSEDERSNAGSEEEAFLSRRLQWILAKKNIN
ncbi:hypothetical protein Taro_000582 [Colocasia esculenta]|uniref:UBN2 domain-containing protein n=1 Tax=Colocasia esculenta TaxID=4460 RepID=A0A843TCH5_COLES|nr:hypothetical protein [Colocasia esculenta]